MQEQIDDIASGIQAMKKDQGQRYTVKKMEATKISLQGRLKSMKDNSRKDDVIDFEQLGIDRLFVDEAHHYKDL